MSNLSKKRGKPRKLRRNVHHDLIKAYGRDILESKNFKEVDDHLQHGSVSVRRHSIDVAKYSLLINKKLKLRANQKDLVRGALLHDYFLYDWHEKGRISVEGLHGFRHPKIALNNAGKEYELTPREKDIIKKHMWPLTVVPPLCREAWIVTAADKYCSILETARIHRGGKLKKSHGKGK